jgi:hypothetical protein
MQITRINGFQAAAGKTTPTLDPWYDNDDDA